MQVSIPNGVFALLFTAIHLTYFAGFRSQAMVAVQRSSSLVFQQFFANPHSKVIIRSDSSLIDEHREVIFGVDGVAKSKNRVIVEPDADKIANILCTNSAIAHYTE